MGDSALTKELRDRLDELGVECGLDSSRTHRSLWWRAGGVSYSETEVAGKIKVTAYYLTPEQAIAATVGKDIEHYDGSGRRGTVAILQGGRKPEEVLFVRDEGGVTHYLPEDAGTCDGSFHKSSDLSSGRVPLYYCKDTNRSIFVEREAKVCPMCGGRIKDEDE